MGGVCPNPVNPVHPVRKTPRRQEFFASFVSSRSKMTTHEISGLAWLVAMSSVCFACKGWNAHAESMHGLFRLPVYGRVCDGGAGRVPWAFDIHFYDQVNSTPCQGRVLWMEATIGTDKPIRPSEFPDVFKASIFIRKPFVELLKCGWIVESAYGFYWLSHTRTLHIVAG